MFYFSAEVLLPFYREPNVSLIHVKPTWEGDYEVQYGYFHFPEQYKLYKLNQKFQVSRDHLLVYNK